MTFKNFVKIFLPKAENHIKIDEIAVHSALMEHHDEFAFGNDNKLHENQAWSDLIHWMEAPNGPAVATHKQSLNEKQFQIDESR